MACFGSFDVTDTLDQVIEFEEEEELQYEEEEEDPQNQYVVRFRNAAKSEELCKCKCLIIAVGHAANLFLTTYIQLTDDDVIGDVAKLSDEPFRLDKQEKRKGDCYLYKIGESIICMSNSVVRAEQTFRWAEKVLSRISSEYVAVLCNLPISDYLRSGERFGEEENDILRSMKNSHYSNDTHVTELEEGNMIKYLPAAILTHCEVKRVPAILYVSFLVSHYIDVFSLKSFLPLLQDDVMKGLKKVPQMEVSKKLRDFEGIGLPDTLYI